jgi:hypothetical protein
MEAQMSFALLFYVILGLSVVLTLASMLAFKRATSRAKAARNSRFAARSPMSVDEIYARFFANSGIDKELFIRNWEASARCLRLNPELLRPDDRLSDLDIGEAMLPSILDDLEDMFRSACKERNLDRKNYDPQTLGELVTIISRKS